MDNGDRALNLESESRGDVAVTGIRTRITVPLSVSFNDHRFQSYLHGHDDGVGRRLTAGNDAKFYCEKLKMKSKNKAAKAKTCIMAETERGHERVINFHRKIKNKKKIKKWPDLRVQKNRI